MKQSTTRLNDVFADAYDKIRKGQLKTLIPFLCLFRLNGKPMDLKLHYQFAPMFNTVQSAHSVYMCGRQLGKSYSISADIAMRNMLIPYYHTVLIQPRADQIQRLINTVYRPLLSSCPVRSMFIQNTELTKMALREFKNGSMCYAEHMFESPDRVRGISGSASVTYDESQDIEYEFLDIGNEMMSASIFWGFARYTGTPKTTDTTLALLWNRSSQAEWVIRCEHCNKFNIPNPEQDLLKMIGKRGPVCAKCGQPVFPKNGGYVHARPERQLSFPGYHISQTVHPLHILSQAKWNRLLDKIENYAPLALYNEVFGWPYDAATSPLTMSDLQKATHDISVQRPADVRGLKHLYSYITVAVDWSGGSMVSDSYTAYAVLGLRRDSDLIDVLYGKRIKHGVTPTDEANEIMDWIRGTGADAFTYDNGGAGFARLEIMNHQGLRETPGLVVIPINYVRPRAGDVMVPHTGMRESDLYYYTLDKSRSLAITVMSIKATRVRVPKFAETDEKAFQRDLLALREDPRKSMGNETVVLIVKKPGVPDDFAHAVNFGCSQIWDHFGAYPKIGTRYDASVLDFDENHNRIMDDEVFGPRGDFERFKAAVDLRATVIRPEDELI